jgi:hypothetical protein
MDRRFPCERSRYLAALAPDGVLSEFELRQLNDHVARCADCGAFASDVARIAETLRTAPLEQSRSQVHVLASSRRRLSLRRLAYLPAAAGVAATLVIATVTVSRSGADRFVPHRPAIVVDATSVEGQAEQAAFLRDLRDYRNAQSANESVLTRDRKPGFLSG